MTAHLREWSTEDSVIMKGYQGLPQDFSAAVLLMHTGSNMPTDDLIEEETRACLNPKNTCLSSLNMLDFVQSIISNPVWPLGLHTYQILSFSRCQGNSCFYPFKFNKGRSFRMDTQSMALLHAKGGTLWQETGRLFTMAL